MSIFAELFFVLAILSWSTHNIESLSQERFDFSKQKQQQQQHNQNDTTARQHQAATSANKAWECQNPDESVLLKKLEIMYTLNIGLIENGIEYNSSAQEQFKNSIVNVPIDTNHTYTTRGERNCSRFYATNWSDEDHISTCPNYFVIVEREHIYPFKRYHSVCSCSKCLHLEGIGSIGCQPVYTAKFALLRGKCNGTEYEWKPVLERVAMSCSCSQFNRYTR